MLNVAALQGRLTADPELKHIPDGTAVCSFTIAVDSNKKDKSAYFIDCVAWRNTAEFISRYFGKGKMILLSGTIATRQWQDKNGNNRKSTEIQVLDASFAGSKSEDGTKPSSPPTGVFVDTDDEDDLIPF